MSASGPIKPRNAFVFLGPDFDADEDAAVRFGEDLCAWLLKRLGELGAMSAAEGVDEEGFGWVIDFAVEGAAHTFWVMNEKGPRWTGGVNRVWPCPASLFRSPHRPTAAALGLVHRSLSQAPGATQLRWHRLAALNRGDESDGAAAP